MKQDVLVTEGTDDHLLPVDRMYRIMHEFTSARSATARVFTAREGAEQHYQVCNALLARSKAVLARAFPAAVLPKPDI